MGNLTMGNQNKAVAKKIKPKNRVSHLHSQKPKACFSVNSPADHILNLQRTIGNQVIQGLLSNRSIQKKLKIGKPNDIYEKEADQIAEQIVNMPEPCQNQNNINSEQDQVPQIQRLCLECKEDLQRAKEEEEEEKEEKLQSKPIADLITQAVQRQAEMEEEKEEEKVQANSLSDKKIPIVQRQNTPEDEEEKIQTKPLAEKITTLVQRQVEPEKDEEIKTKSFAEQITPLVQRQIEPEEEEQKIQTKSLSEKSIPFVERQVESKAEESLQTKKFSNHSKDISSNIEQHINSIRTSGQHMSRSVREYFEPRFGYDFSHVRLHTDSHAAETAKAINAKAFTIGKDIVFGYGLYAPYTQKGKRLLSHELAHVVQQNAGTNNRFRSSGGIVQTWGWGSGTVAGEPNFRPVARSHRPRVRAAMRILGRIVGSQRCRNYFRDHCPGGTAATLQNLYRRMRVWGLHENGSLGGNSGDNVAYEEPYIYRVGRFSIAATLLHELMHMCGIGTTAADERTCELAVERCRAYTPFIEYVRPRWARVGSIVRIVGYGFGVSQGSADRVLFNGINAGRAISWGYSHNVGSEIRIRVPASARSGRIVVINNNVRSNGFRFRVRR